MFTLEFSCLEPHADAEPPTAPTDSVGGVSKLFTVGGNGEELNNFTYRGDTWRQQWGPWGVSNANHGKNGEETTKGPKETWWVWLLWLGNEAWILFSLFSVEYL